jgi:hypothetical protein
MNDPETQLLENIAQMWKQHQETITRLNAAVKDADLLLLALADQACATISSDSFYDSWGVRVYADLLRYLDKVGYVVLIDDNGGKQVTADPKGN